MPKSGGPHGTDRLTTQIDVGVSSMDADEVVMRGDGEHKWSELLWHVSGLPTLGMHGVAQLNNHYLTLMRDTHKADVMVRWMTMTGYTKMLAR